MSVNGNHRDRADSETDESEPTRTELFNFILLLIVLGPFGLIFAHKMEDPMVFLWGVGTSLLYVGMAGLIMTVPIRTVVENLGLGPLLETATASLATASDALMAVSQMPVTYAVLFAVGLAIVAAGVHRLAAYDPDDIIERTND